MVIFVGSALGYALFGRTSPSTTPNESAPATQGVSCGITPSTTASSAAGCSMMSGTTTTQTTSSQPAVQVDTQAQVITMNYDESGLTPATVNLEVGKSYTISINVTTDVYGCMNSIYIPGLDDTIQSVRK